MNRMSVRTRVTVSLPAEQVQRVDREARARGTTRSAVMSEWLRFGARHQASLALDAEITAYYTTMSAEETEQDAAIARASTAAARSLDFDEVAAAPVKTKRRKSA